MKETPKDGWFLTYTEFKKEDERLRESLTTIGNGYLGTRGSFMSERAGDDHYPGTYIAGLYNKLGTEVHGRTIYNDDFVNCPHWLLTEIRIGDGEWLRPLYMEILSYEHTLDMHKAHTYRSLRVKDEQDRITRIVTSQFVSMANHHLGALQCTIVPENYSDTIEIRSALDGTVINRGVERYRKLNSKHLMPIDQSSVDGNIYVHVQTTQSHIDIVMCARNSVVSSDEQITPSRSSTVEDGYVAETLSFGAVQGNEYTFEKMVGIATSKDRDVSSFFDAARTIAYNSGSFAQELSRHADAWEYLWNRADIVIQGDEFSQQVLRLHSYHLLSTASPHNTQIDAGIPARGLHGEPYRGHIFWDTVFILPFYATRFPEIVRANLLYRYRRLDAARSYAREYGYKGAMIPWQQSSDGQEETQMVHYNPVSGNWDPDLSRRQRHISIAVFYNVWFYYQHTYDTDFLWNYGAEMLIEIARFWASITSYDSKNDRYHINGVMGPNEFHEKYPGASEQEGGINDNAYTNISVVWVLRRTLELIDMLPEHVRGPLFEKIAFDKRECERWEHITSRMYVAITEDGIISQYDGFMDLKEIDWEKYKKKYGDIGRMDRILKSEGDSPDNYRVAKQADALMLFYMFPADEVLSILNDLGYHIDDRDKFMRGNYNFYLGCTTHGSSLSKVAHAAMAPDMGYPEKLWDWFMEALKSDVYDTQGGTTAEAIHTGVMGGTIDIVTRIIGGVRINDNGQVSVHPNLPQHWEKIEFTVAFRGKCYSASVTHDNITVEMQEGTHNPRIDYSRHAGLLTQAT